jgi:hypothetical protein
MNLDEFLTMRQTNWFFFALGQGWPTFFISGPKYGPKKFSGPIFLAN